MEIIREGVLNADETLARVALRVDRLTLRKRRWRGEAADGTEFGFDLAEPLADGDVFFQSAEARYQLQQEPEPVLAITLGAAADAARLGWNIGNLHFQIAVAADTIQVPDDPALRQMLAREGIEHRAVLAVFRPLVGQHTHEH